jgi:hypothetical protein
MQHSTTIVRELDAVRVKAKTIRGDARDALIERLRQLDIAGRGCAAGKGRRDDAPADGGGGGRGAEAVPCPDAGRGVPPGRIAPASIACCANAPELPAIAYE